MKSKFNFIRIPLILINIIVSIILLIGVNKLDILPTRYFVIAVAAIVIINLLICLLLCLKNIVLRIIGIIFSILLVITSIIGTNYINETNQFLDTSFNNNVVEISSYNVLVIKDSPYNKLEDLTDKTLGYLKDDKDSLSKLNKVVRLQSNQYEDLYGLYEKLLNGEIDSIMLNEAYIDVLKEDYPDIDEKIKVLYTFDLETIIEKKPTTSVEEEILRPINIFISGSDSRSDSIINKSRSDVNMLVTINPKTHQILLTSIPRDYYVQVHGQTGLKDKLTHAGIYGIDISTKTVEDLFDIKIDYSIKIGMNAVPAVVDLVGGIEIYSDITFKSFHMPGWVVKEGMNKMDGAKALAYARERYAYTSGDRHRIRNQQQVLEAVLKKVLADKTILLKYDELLNTLGDLYRTDIPREVITDFVKEQLDTMPTWKFETQWVNGEGASMNTYTAPSYKLYVMIPYEEDVKRASTKIKEVLSN